MTSDFTSIAPPNTDTMALVEALAGRLDQVVGQRKQLEDEEKFLRQRLSTLCPIGVTKAGEFSISVRENRRFDPLVAQDLLTPEEVLSCCVTTISASKAREVLPPARYAECQAPAGDPVVRVS